MQPPKQDRTWQISGNVPSVPELPDITIYIEVLRARLLGKRLENVRLISPFFARTVEPALTDVQGKTLRGLSRLGKRIVMEFDDDLFMVIHLMIAGRVQWKKKQGKLSPRTKVLAAFEFDDGILTIIEACTKKRASLHCVRGAEKLTQFNAGGLEVIDSTLEAFRDAMTCENHTLKRALTDPRVLSGIGNAYSDEILHRARLSPLAMTQKLSHDKIKRLFQACKETLTEWTERLRELSGGELPQKVTAFHPEMAVHGKYGNPCPICGTTIQRIRYKENETNYCPRCQTGGRIFADRALSRLLKDDWPSTIDEMET